MIELGASNDERSEECEPEEVNGGRGVYLGRLLSRSTEGGQFRFV